MLGKCFTIELYPRLFTDLFMRSWDGILSLVHTTKQHFQTFGFLQTRCWCIAQVDLKLVILLHLLP